MTIRPALEDDLPVLVDIFNAAIIHTDSTRFLTPQTVQDRRSWWNEHLDPRYPIWVLEEAGAVVGYASLSSWLDGPLYARTTEASVFLLPEARGQGQGTRLLHALLRAAGDLGHHAIIARVWSSNEISLALFRRCGFAVIGVQPEVGSRHGEWLDCVILQYLLPASSAD